MNLKSKKGTDFVTYRVAVISGKVSPRVYWIMGKLHTKNKIISLQMIKKGWTL